MSQFNFSKFTMENGVHGPENKPNWKYQSCDCCPYGYHIDLDFVRYCETLKECADYSGSIKRRRERRRQRQSMEVLLGLANPVPISASTVPYSVQSTGLLTSPLNKNSASSQIQYELVEDALGDVVTDFERTLERSSRNKNLSNNKSLDTSVAVVSSGAVGDGFNLTNSPSDYTNGDVNDLDSIKAANACTLKNIRKQMALGLERMRELEEQVKVIPTLQVQISLLKDEKHQLLEHIRHLNVDMFQRQKSTITTRRDVGVGCGPLTRTISVGPQYPRTRSISTTTNFLQIQQEPDKKFQLISKGSQTFVAQYADSEMQTSIYKHTINCGINVKPITVDVTQQFSSQTRSIGTSNDSILDNLCNKCNILTRTIGVGPASPADGFTPVSLKSLSVPRSKSFNLGEEKLGLSAKQRTIGCQSENFSVTRASQYEPKVSTKACQFDFVKKMTNKSVQYEHFNFHSQYTDTSDLKLGKSVYTNTPIRSTSDATNNTIKPRMCDAFCNTLKLHLVDASTNTTEATLHAEENYKKEDALSVSRIPRLAHSPSTERHKLRRQDTYTKIPAPAVSVIGLSGIDLSPTNTAPTIDTVESECSSSFSKAKQNFNLSIATIQTNDVCSNTNKQVQPNASLPVSESTLFNASDKSSRAKAVPSKEMQAAMKVLNDSLQKSKHNSSGISNSTKSHLKNALSIIQQEWFRVSSLINANPLDVEDYLDRFEEISNSLLQYIVNMTDDSGNTAMHYAVSHGNFDVVSILLDSKVCNINKPNKAGYTSVMLVSLTEVKSQTDATVVRRLFQMADVNIRAKQHGQTALMLAVSHGRLDMVQMLLEAGADINIQDEDGSTALMCAAEHGHIEIVKYFLCHSEIDSSIVDVDGSTALKIALEAGHKDIGVLLYAHEHSVQGISPYSSLKQRKTKNASGASSSSVSRSPSRGNIDNKQLK